MPTKPSPKARPKPSLIVHGDEPKELPLTEVPNWLLKELMRGGQQEAWDEAVARIAAKLDRGDYGTVGADSARQSRPDSERGSAVGDGEGGGGSAKRRA